MKFTKCLFGLALSFLPMTAQAQWDNCYYEDCGFDNNCYPEYSCCQEPECCPEYDYALSAPIVAPSECGNFYVEGSYLLWRPHCDHLTPGWVNTIYPNTGTNEDTVNSVKLKERKFKYNWDSGFRVAVGYGLPCDQWSARVNYTYFYSTARDHFVAESGQLDNEDPVVEFLPFAFQDNFNIGGSDATLVGNSDWKVELHQADFELTREFYVGCYLSLRPYVGGRFLWLEQKTHLLFEQNFTDAADPSTETGSSSLTSNAKCRFYGGGIKAGLESHYELACGFGLYGDGQISLLYGEFTILNHNDFFTNTEAGGLQPTDGTTLQNARDDCTFCSLKPVFDYSFGLYFRNDFNCCRNMIEIRAGWEHHIYFSQNQFYGQINQSVGESRNFAVPARLSAFNGKNELRGGDLSFAGLAVTASILF